MLGSSLHGRVLLSSLCGVVAAFALSGCVDAPITADQIEADGTLRGGSAMGGQQAAFAAPQQEVAQAVRVSAVLAAQADGPLEDRAAFDAGVGTVYLHVRADGLLSTRDVTYRWRHDDFEARVPGTLQASDAMALGARFDIPPDQAGHWEVDVLAAPTGLEAVGAEPRVLFHREFVVDPAE